MNDPDKRNKMFQVVDLIDEKYIEEADPARARRKRIIKRTSGIAACVILLLTAVNLWLFLPYTIDPPDVSEYADSEYYAVIQKINEITCPKPEYKNNYDKYIINGLWAKPRAPLQDGGISDSESFTNGIQPTYVETTDNQVSGVIESDIIKRSDKYIYYLDYGILKVYTVNQEESKEIGAYQIVDKDTYELYYYHPEFYLSRDCKTITVIMSKYYNDGSFEVISLDVSDPTDIVEQKRISFHGYYMSSRLSGDEILLMSEFSVYEPDFSDEKSYLPYIDTGYGTEFIEPENIYPISNGDEYAAYFTNIYLLDQETLEVNDNISLLGQSNQIYVSNSRVYLSGYYIDRQIKYLSKVNTTITELNCVSYSGSALKYEGNVSFKGRINNQYSMDEYGNYLRVVTTTRESKDSRGEYEENINASLYCINIDTWQIDASMEGFAPPNESVSSVRFDKEKVYVCTSIQLSDPVFFFDLSDIHNISVKDTGTISGYSTSLVDFGNGYLLGIGFGGSFDSFKAEIYTETETDVEPVCTYYVPKSYFSDIYKSYLIDRENRFIGLGLENQQYAQGIQERYVLLYFDGNELREVVNLRLPGNNDYKRAAYIDGYLYMFSYKNFQVAKVELPE